MADSEKNIGNLNVLFEGETESLVKSIEKTVGCVKKLADSIESLNKVTLLKGVSDNFTKIAEGLKRFSNETKDLDIARLKDATESANNLGESIYKITKSADKLGEIDIGKLTSQFMQLGSAVEPFLQKLKEHEAVLENFGKTVDFSKMVVQLDVAKATVEKINKQTELIGVRVDKEKVNREKANVQLEMAQRRLENLNEKQKDLNLKTKTYNAFWSTLWKVGKLAFALRAIKRIGAAFTNVINTASDFNEALNKFQSATQEYYFDALEFSRQFAQNMGLAETTVMDFQSTFMNMLNAIEGVTKGQANELSKSLMIMATDYASLFNTSLNSAMEAFQSMLAGRTMALRTSSGIDTTDNTIYQYYEKIYEKFGDTLGDKKTLNSLTVIEKRMLRIYAVYEQMSKSKAVDDYSETIGNFSNQARIFTEQLKELKVWTGNLMQAFISSWLPTINGILIAITDVVKGFAYLAGYKENAPKEGIFDSDELEDENKELVEMQKNLGLLSFDRFETLKVGKNSNSDVEDSATIDAIYKEMQESIKKMQENMQGTVNPAREIADNILRALGFTQKEVKEQQKVNGEIVETTRSVWTLGEGYQSIEKTLQAILSIVDTLIALKIAKLIGEIDFSTKSLTLSIESVTTAVNGLGIFAIIYSIRSLITQWDELDAKGKAFYFTIIGVATAITLAVNGIKLLSSVKPLLDTLGVSVKGLTNSFTALSVALGMVGLSMWIFKEMDSWSPLGKVIAGSLFFIAGGITAVAVAYAALQSAISAGVAIPLIVGGVALATAGITSAVKGAMEIGQYASGGFPEQGQLFIANEAGPELVGKMGNKTTVANNVQIIQGVEEGCYRGFIRAMTQSDGNNIELTFNINDGEVARALFDPLVSEARRKGYNVKLA